MDHNNHDLSNGFVKPLFCPAPTWHFILIGTIIQSLCLIYQPALFAMVQDSLPPERRGMGSSIIQLIYGAFNTPGPVIAGFLMMKFGVSLINVVNAIYARDVLGVAENQWWLVYIPLL
ncbi:MAG: MFS transporter [Candidatus Bathyarchaeia archaeon]